jgi:hypothetical protein
MALNLKHREIEGLSREVRGEMGVLRKGSSLRRIKVPKGKKLHEQTTHRRGMRVLRKYQDRILEGEVKRNTNVLINAPTGSGKSFATQLLAAKDRLDGNRIVILVPNRVIGTGFAREREVPVDGIWHHWQPILNLCSTDDQLTELRTKQLRQALMAKPGSPVLIDPKKGRYALDTDIVICTSAAFLSLWNQQGKHALNHREVIQNCTFVVDEAHHGSAVFLEEDDDYSLAKQHEIKERQTGIGSFIHFLLNNGGTCTRLILVSATLFRGDESFILSSEARKQFKAAYYCPWPEYWQEAGFERLDLLYELYGSTPPPKDLIRAYEKVRGASPLTTDMGPMLLVADRIQAQRNRKHIVYFPNKNRAWCRADSCELFKLRLKQVWPDVRVLDLVDQSHETRTANTKILNSEPENAAAEKADRSKFDVLLLCGMEEGLDWPIADTLHSLIPPQTLTKNIQRNGRVYRTWEGKKHIIVYNYLSDNNNAVSQDDYKQLLEERTAAALVGMQCDDLVEELFVGSEPAAKKNSQHYFALSQIFGHAWENAQRSLIHGWVKLSEEERKARASAERLAKQVADQHRKECPLVQKHYEAVVEALIRYIARMLPAEYRQKIGLKLASIRRISDIEWKLLMKIPGSAQYDALQCRYTEATGQALREYLRRPEPLSFEELFQKHLERAAQWVECQRQKRKAA